MLTCFKNLSISIILIIALAGCNNSPPQAVRGVLDLSEWNFQQHQQIKLQGEWEFYWQKLLLPRQMDTVSTNSLTYQNVPATWSNYTIKGEQLHNEGFASYRLHVIVDSVGVQYAIKMGEVFTAYKIWINGTEIYSGGVVGSDRNSSKPQYRPHTTTFRVDQDTIDVVLQISNFHYKDGGINSAIEFGLGQDLVPKNIVGGMGFLHLSAGHHGTGLQFFKSNGLKVGREFGVLHFASFGQQDFRAQGNLLHQGPAFHHRVHAHQGAQIGKALGWATIVATGGDAVFKEPHCRGVMPQ